MGCAVSMALLDSPRIAAGGGKLAKIILVDPDCSELSNLHRQIIFTQEGLGLAKAMQAAEFIQRYRSDIEVQPVVARLESVDEIISLAQGSALIVDGSDNFTTRFHANDASLSLGTPLVHGAAIGFSGQLMTVFPGRSACLRCIFHSPPTAGLASCRSEGVLGPLVGEVGWLMAMEVIKIIHGEGSSYKDRLLTIDAVKQRRHQLTLCRRAGCSGCGDKN